MSSIKLFRFTFWSAIFIIFFIATKPGGIELFKSIWDKLKHSFAFFVLYILFSFAYPKLNIKIKVLSLIGYGVLIEIVQYFIPTREFSLEDIFADSIGIISGVIFIKVIKRYYFV